jgi:prepilin-type N-terminal cleavage/methylation domain-containing protein
VKCRAAGFTLIELAVVLMIMGFLLGCALKGQQLNEMAKVKELTIDFRNVPTLVNTYKDIYHAWPGDDPDVSDHLGASATACSPASTAKCAPGNDVIDGAWTDTTVASESFLFWQQLRLAGLANGSTDTSRGAAYLPTNALGGMMGVQGTRNFTTITKTSTGASNPMRGDYVVCSKGIPGKIAAQLDSRMDDGNPDTGALRIADPANYGQSISLATLSKNPDQVFTVCMGT